MTKAKFKSFWDKFGTLTILIFLMACLSIASPKYFLTLDNFKQIGLQSTVYILLAFGEFFAILLAGIDLSVGSVAALTGTFIALMLKAEVPVAVAILLGLLISIAFGVVNGALINALDLHPFVVTLGSFQRISDLWTAGIFQEPVQLCSRIPDSVDLRIDHDSYPGMVHEQYCSSKKPVCIGWK